MKAQLHEHKLSPFWLEGASALDYLSQLQMTYRKVAEQSGVKPGTGKLPGLPD